MTHLNRDAIEWAKRLVREKIDLENKYLASAQYEMPGHKLVTYLAFAYQEGQKSKKG